LEDCFGPNDGVHSSTKRTDWHTIFPERAKCLESGKRATALIVTQTAQFNSMASEVSTQSWFEHLDEGDK
jgi:hypothetical protein